MEQSNVLLSGLATGSGSASSGQPPAGEADNKPWNRTSLLQMGAQKVLQARRTVKTMQQEVSEKVADADQKYGLSERAASTKKTLTEAGQSLAVTAETARQELAGTAVAVDQRLGLSERAAEISQKVSAVDEKHGLTPGLNERLSLLKQEFSEVGSEFSTSAAGHKQKLMANMADLSQKTAAAAWQKAAALGLPRELGAALDPLALCFYDAKILPGTVGQVGLTIDDGPCHQSDPSKCMLREVQDLLAEFDAKATLFLCTDHVPPHEQDLVRFLKGGHEVANHCGADRSYGLESEEDFQAVFLKSESVCENLRHLAAIERSLDTIPSKGAKVAEADSLLPPPLTDEHASAVPSREPEEVCAQVLRDATRQLASDAVEPSLESDALETSLTSGAASSVDDAKVFSPPARVPNAGGAAGPQALAVPSSKSNLETISEAVVEPQKMVLPQRPARWFRAPHADKSPAMQCVLDRHGFTNVLCDCFANDTVLSDPEVIAQGLLSMVDGLGGSVVVIHIPERGFREHNFTALRLFLVGLREKGLRATTLTSLNEAAWEGGVATSSGAVSAVTSRPGQQTPESAASAAEAAEDCRPQACERLRTSTEASWE